MARENGIGVPIRFSGRIKLTGEATELRRQANDFKRQANDPNVAKQIPQGSIEHPDFPHLSNEEYRAFEKRINEAETRGDTAAAQQIRYERYKTNKTNSGIPEGEIAGFDEWLPTAERAQANAERGNVHENAALDELRVINNNYVKDSNGKPILDSDGNPRRVVMEPVLVDGLEIVVRPDGVSETMWIDVKSLEGQRPVQDFTQQLQGEYKLAVETHAKKLGIIISSENPQSRPSSVLAGKSEVMIFRRNPLTGEWFVWEQSSFIATEDGWSPIQASDARGLVGSK